MTTELSRRNFLASTAVAATTLPLALKASPQIPLGVQLYTVRDLPAANLAATLRAIHQIGYTEVETYWDV